MPEAPRGALPGAAGPRRPARPSSRSCRGTRGPSRTPRKLPDAMQDDRTGLELDPGGAAIVLDLGGAAGAAARFRVP